MPIPREKNLQRAYSFGHLLKTVELVEDKSPFFWYHSFFSAKSANFTVFRIPILLVIEIFLCEAYRFQKTSQTSDDQENTPLVPPAKPHSSRSFLIFERSESQVSYKQYTFFYKKLGSGHSTKSFLIQQEILSILVLKVS